MHRRIFVLLFLFSSVLAFTASAQKHILPKKIKEERQLKGSLENTSSPPQLFDFRTKTGTDKMPEAAGTWMPGEFEESDAVLLSWITDGEGNPDTLSTLAVISYQLCVGIQPEAVVWIRINKASDSAAIKRYMAVRGHPLYNYRFMVKFGDDWWARDFGPIGYYAGSGDTVVLADFKYYSGREHDNANPANVSWVNGFGHHITRMHYEGGNLIADGFGKVFYSDVVRDVNASTGYHFPTLSANLVADSMRIALQANQVVQLPTLNCDGGTGHLDLYLKLMDEETWIAGQYPSVVTASDKTISEANVNYLKTLNSVYGRKYRIFRVPLPTDNNGSYSQQITCANQNNNGRSFVNGITVNKTFIYPIWDSPGSGNTTQRLQVEANLKKWFPGMKLFGIDVRAMTGFGGQLHCITMQIPAKNPVKFWHPAYRDLQPLQSSYHLVSEIKNKSGIASAICKWRKGSNGTWNEVVLTDSSGYFIGNLADAGFAIGDTIQYYLTATTNNGKTAYKPITGPEGYFEFVIANITGILQGTDSETGFALYPNPGQGNIRFNSPVSTPLDVRVYDFSGKECLHQTFPADRRNNEHELNIKHLPGGLYLVSLFSDGQRVWSGKYTKN